MTSQLPVQSVERVERAKRVTRCALGLLLFAALVLRLRDVERPDRQCDSDHPLSGCITVDWSDFEGRPGVPPGGVFDNHLTIQLASGPRTFYLSETGSLANEPDSHAPG